MKHSTAAALQHRYIFLNHSIHNNDKITLCNHLNFNTDDNTNTNVCSSLYVQGADLFSLVARVEDVTASISKKFGGPSTSTGSAPRPAASSGAAVSASGKG